VLHDVVLVWSVSVHTHGVTVALYVGGLQGLKASRTGGTGGRLWSNRHVLETPAEIDRLQELLDRSAAGAGAHLRSIASDERRLGAARVCERLQGMRLLVVATVTADGRPLAGPVDGYFLHGSFYFSSSRDSVRMRHLAARPAVSATYLEGEELAVTVHGRAELFDLSDPAHGELRQAMLDHYLPKQGPAFETWLDEIDAVGARIDAAKMFTYSTSDLALLARMIEGSMFTCPSCSVRRSG